MSSQYAQALEQQRRFARWLASPAGVDEFYDQQPDQVMMRAFYGVARLTLASADPYYWHPDMCRLLEALSDEMPQWTLRRESLPTDFGFCWFPAPLALPHEWNRVEALAWGIESNTLVVTVYGHDMRAAAHTWPFLSFRWPFGEAKAVDEVGAESDTASQLRSARRIWRYAAAIFALLEQRILVATPASIDRAALRRLKRAKARQPPAILIVRLRREVREGNDASGQPREWPRPWIVRSHWRQQYYPSDGSHRPILILPYIKAKDAPGPLVSAERVFAVVR